MFAVLLHDIEIEHMRLLPKVKQDKWSSPLFCHDDEVGKQVLLILTCARKHSQVHEQDRWV